ncbi:MAG TPA: sugar phosphate isomerase/epimerase [Armatimonadota bacterium]
MKLGLINSAWLGTHVSLEEGIRNTKKLGFDTLDLQLDPLDVSPKDLRLAREVAEEVGLPIVSVCCVAPGLIDINPPVRAYNLDRVRRHLDLVYGLGGRNLLLVLGEYIWQREVIPPEVQWGWAVEGLRDLGRHAADLGLEIALELEPFDESLLNSVERMAAFVDEVAVPQVRANCDISHLHLVNTPFEDVAKLAGRIAHVHLSDCDGKVHGDLPPGRGCTPIKEYLAAIRDTGFDGVVSIELEFSPEPSRILDWVTEAYEQTDRIMRELNCRA